MDETEGVLLGMVRKHAREVTTAYDAWLWDMEDDAFQKLDAAMARLRDSLIPFVPGYQRKTS